MRANRIRIGDHITDDHGCSLPVTDVSADADYAETVITYPGCSLDPGLHIWTVRDSDEIAAVAK